MNGEDIFFKLNEEFLDNYKGKQPNWGFGGLGYVVFKRTYSRKLSDGKSEEYWQTLKRVVEGVFTIQKRHCINNKLPWNGRKANNSAQRMFELMWEFKFTPPGRGLWVMGTEKMWDIGSACLQNCAYHSTENITIDFAEPFCFLMDMSMLGVGVGGDVKGAGKITIRQPKLSDEPFVVPDTREGWVELLRVLLNAYVGKNDLPKEIDYSLVRPKGAIIKGFGGIASGPQPLIDMYASIKEILDSRIGGKITSSDIVDIFNLVGKCVVSGGVRRTAEIMFGDYDDEEFLQLKNPEINKDKLYSHRWASNNSVYAKVGMDYSKVAKMTGSNGEPGYVWLDTAKKFSRLVDKEDNKDYRISGTNPCGEQGLESGELCNLVETYMSNHNTLEEWMETLKYAYLYAKTVTLLPTHRPLSNTIMNRNRRIGTSISGITQSFTKFGRRKVLDAMDDGYIKIQEWDKTYSDWLGIPRSIKTTTVKPSGSVSLLAGVTPGVHYPISEYYVRNIRFQDDDKLLEKLIKSGYKAEKDKYSLNTFVVSFPVKIDNFDRSVQNVSMWEQLEIVAQIQKYWSDNLVSATVTFSKEEAPQIEYALQLYEDRLKGVSLLPRLDHGYEQAPYIAITEDEYNDMVKDIKKLNKISVYEHESDDKFCTTDYCEVKTETSSLSKDII